MRSNELGHVVSMDPLREMRAWMRMFPWAPTPTDVMPEMADKMPLDVYEDNGHLVVKCPLPGMRKEDIKLHLQGDMLTISAERHEEKEIRKEDYYMKEVETGHWTRSIRLPNDLVMDKVHATYVDGTLLVRFPRNLETSPKSMDIKVS